MRRLCIALTIVFLFNGLLAADSVKNSILNVPDQYKTVQDAIDNAVAGDTVLIHPGTYRETIAFKTGITLKGIDPDICILALENDSARYIIRTEGCDMGKITNLTFDAANGNLPDNETVNALEIVDSSIVVEKVVIRNSHTNGIFVSSTHGSKPVIRDNLCMGCYVGILLDGNSKASVEGNTCKGNSYGMALVGADPKLVVKKNRCIYNIKSGFSYEADVKVVLTGNDLSFNGQCGLLAMEGTPVLKNNKLNNNGEFGIYIVTDLSQPVIDKTNEFKNNKSGPKLENN